MLGEKRGSGFVGDIDAGEQYGKVVDVFMRTVNASDWRSFKQHIDGTNDLPHTLLVSQLPFSTRPNKTDVQWILDSFVVASVV